MIQSLIVINFVLLVFLHASNAIVLDPSGGKMATGVVSATLTSIHNAKNVLPKSMFDIPQNDVLKAAVLPSVDTMRNIVGTADVNTKSASVVSVTSFKERELSASFTCESFSAYSVYSVCSDVVNYPFYMAAGDSFDTMEASIRADLETDGGSLWSMRSFVNSACMSDYKKLKCAEVYKPCVDNVVADDTSTYVNSLPYKLPCSSLCIAVTYLGSSCAGLFEGFGTYFSCTDTSVYDTSNDNTVCNDLSAWSGINVVSERYEAYAGTVCDGLIGDVYLGDPQAIIDLTGSPMTTLAPLLPTGAQQGVIETIVSFMETTVPRYLYPSCLTDMRKLFCAHYFPAPEAKSDLSAYFGTTYLPRMPQYDVCTDFMDSCSTVVADGEILNSLSLDCNVTVSGVRGFPATTQVVSAIPLSGGTVYMTTDPFSYSETVDESFYIGDECIPGFTSKELPVGLENEVVTYMLEGASNCKLSCPSNLLWDEEDIGTTIHDAVIVLNILFFSLAMFNTMLMPSKYRNYRTLALGAAVTLNMVLLVLNEASAPNPEYSSCSSDVSSFSEKTAGDSFSGSMCLMYAYTREVLLVPFMTFCFSLVIAEIYLQVVLNVKANLKLYMTIVTCVLAVFYTILITTFLVKLHTMPEEDRPSHYITNNPLSPLRGCTFQDVDSMKWSIVTVPNAIVLLMLAGLLIHMFYVCFTITLKAARMKEGNPILELWKTYKPLILLTLAFELTMLVIHLFIYMRISEYRTGENVPYEARRDKAAILEYMTCLVTSFVSYEVDPSGRAACVRPDKHLIELDTLIFSEWAFTFNIFLVFVVSLNKIVKKWYWERLPVSVKNWLMDNIYNRKIVPTSDEMMKEVDAIEDQTVDDEASREKENEKTKEKERVAMSLQKGTFANATNAEETKLEEDSEV